MAIFQDIDTTDGGDTREEGHQKTDANWATLEAILSAENTKMLVAGGVGSAPVMTTATGTGSPVRANTPTLITPVLGAATGTSVVVTGAITTSAGNITATAGNVTAGGTVQGTTSGKFDTVIEITTDHGVEIDGITLKDGGALILTGGTNTFNLTNGTASLDVAAGCTVNIDGSISESGTMTYVGGTNTFNLACGTASIDIATAKVVNIDDNLTITNGLTVNGGNAGTISFGAAGKTLTITGDATIASTPVSPVGLQTIWIPAIAMTPRTTNGAGTGIVEMSTYKNMLHTLDFATGSDEFAQFCIQMPKSWNEGTITAQFVWSHTSGGSAFGVSWWIQAVAVANGEALDASYGTPVYANDTGGTADYCYISPTTGAMTVAGSPAANEYVMFQILRDVSDGGDTLDIDARLHGVQLYYTTDAGTDA